MASDALPPQTGDEAGGAALSHVGPARAHGAVVVGVGAFAARPGVGEGEGVELVGVFFVDFAAVLEFGFFAGFVVFDFGGAVAVGWGAAARAVLYLLEPVAETHGGGCMLKSGDVRDGC